MSTPTPFGPMMCRQVTTVSTGHRCVCVVRKGHPSDGENQGSWHQCGECGTVWTDEQTLEFGPEAGKTAKVIRIPSNRVDVDLSKSIGSAGEGCIVCGETQGLRVQSIFGEYVHSDCTTHWTMACEVARQHVLKIFELSSVVAPDWDADSGPYRYAARVFCQISASSRGQR